MFNGLIAFTISSAVFFFRMYQIFQYGSQFPINDSWASEYVTLYKPYLEGNLQGQDFFIPNLEHYIALQKAVHLGLYMFLEEWNPLVQMVFNNLLFSILIFGMTYVAGCLKAPFCFHRILQGLVLSVGLMPIPAENYLWGFQTAWYLYYILSALVVFCITSSKSFDLWWVLAFILSILSCLCLASGVVNLALCGLAPFLYGWPNHQLKNPIQLKKLWGLMLIILPCVLIAKNVFAVRASQPNPFELFSVLKNTLQVFSFPILFIPITYLPLFAVLKDAPPFSKTASNNGLRIQLFFGFWAFLHLSLIILGRGGFSIRYAEILLFGVLANAALFISWFELSHRDLGKITSQQKQRTTVLILWFALMAGGLCLQAARSLNYGDNFAKIHSDRQVTLMECFQTKNLNRLKEVTRLSTPSNVFNANPELLFEPVLQKILPSFYRSDLTLEPGKILAKEIPTEFYRSLPFPLWFGIKGENGKTQKASISNVPSPWVKVAFTGKTEDARSGINSTESATQKTDGGRSFSQPEGWQALFLKAQNRRVSFEARTFDRTEWLLFQEPICISHMQYAIEILLSHAQKIMSLLIGGSVFLLILSTAIDVKKGI